MKKKPPYTIRDYAIAFYTPRSTEPKSPEQLKHAEEVIKYFDENPSVLQEVSDQEWKKYFLSNTHPRPDKFKKES